MKIYRALVLIVLVNCVVVRLFLYEKMDGSSVVSFRVKGDSDSVFDEEQWQETVLIGDDDKVQVNQVKEDGLSSEESHKTLSHFQDKVFEQMEKQQV